MIDSNALVTDLLHGMAGPLSEAAAIHTASHSKTILLYFTMKQLLF